MRAIFKTRFENIEKAAAALRTDLAGRAKSTDVASLRADLAHARDDVTFLRTELERVRAGAQGAADAAETSALRAVKLVRDRAEEIGTAAASHGSAIADLQAALAGLQAKVHDHPEFASGGVVAGPAAGDAVPLKTAPGEDQVVKPIRKAAGK